jgi:predicted metalloendopeptidase
MQIGTLFKFSVVDPDQVESETSCLSGSGSGIIIPDPDLCPDPKENGMTK